MKKILFFCIAVLSCTVILAQNSVDLKLNPEKNKVYRFNSVSEQTTVQTVNGNQQTVESKTNYTTAIKMLDATTDFMIVEVHLDTLITKTNTMGKNITISSQNEGNVKSADNGEIMSFFMNRLSKNALYVKMDYKGKVLEVVNSKMLSDIILKDTSSITLTGPTAPAIKNQIKNLISDNSLKTMVEMFTHFVPGKQVSAGDNWNETVSTTSGGMNLDIKTDYHLNGLTDKNADIVAESSIKASLNAGPIVSGGATITYDGINGLTKSTLLIDITTGLIVEHKGKTHITGNLGVSYPGGSMQIPMDINSTSKVMALN
jgi:hypothetical protein